MPAPPSPPRARRSSGAAPRPRPPGRLAVLVLALAHAAGWLPLAVAQPSEPRPPTTTPPRAWGVLIGLLLGGCAGATFAALLVRAALNWALWARDAHALARKAARRSASGPPPLPCVPEEGEPLEACLLVHEVVPPSSPTRRQGVLALLGAAPDAPTALLPR